MVHAESMIEREGERPAHSRPTQMREPIAQQLLSLENQDTFSTKNYVAICISGEMLALPLSHLSKTLPQL